MCESEMKWLPKPMKLCNYLTSLGTGQSLTTETLSRSAWIVLAKIIWPRYSTEHKPKENFIILALYHAASIFLKQKAYARDAKSYSF